jgi:hypothetical protein
MSLRRFVAVALTCVVNLAATPAVAAPPANVEGFRYPESAFWDQARGYWYVSNFGGDKIDPGGREEDGYLSLLDVDGNVVVERWVQGLRSPKGIRMSRDVLFVADVGQVVVIDVTAPPHITRRIDLDAIGAQFPNDVATHPRTGDLYVSDLLRNAIYRIDRKTLTPSMFLESPELESPNGLAFDHDGDKLLVASYGPGIDPDTLRTSSPGRVLQVDLATLAVAPFRNMARTGSLDGIEWYGRHLLVTDNPGGRLLEVAEDGTVAERAKDLTNPADLGVSRPAGDVAIPLLRANRVRFLRLPPPS